MLRATRRISDVVAQGDCQLAPVIVVQGRSLKSAGIPSATFIHLYFKDSPRSSLGRFRLFDLICNMFSLIA